MHKNGANTAHFHSHYNPIKCKQNENENTNKASFKIVQFIDYWSKKIEVKVRGRDGGGGLIRIIVFSGRRAGKG